MGFKQISIQFPKLNSLNFSDEFKSGYFIFSTILPPPTILRQPPAPAQRSDRLITHESLEMYFSLHLPYSFFHIPPKRICVFCVLSYSNKVRSSPTYDISQNAYLSSCKKVCQFQSYWKPVSQSLRPSQPQKYNENSLN